jgi:hypothetical protein
LITKEEGDTQLLFQFSNRNADGRLTFEESFGGCPESAVLYNGMKHL